MSDSEAPHTPPRNTKALKPYFSPDGNTLSSVIAAGGLNVVSGIPNGKYSSGYFALPTPHPPTIVLTDPNRVEEEMHFYPIDHTLDLVDLMRRKPPRFETEDNEFFFKSQVVFYPMQELGRGQFKTACAGQLVCLGSSDYTASFSKCVFKRPFQKTDKVEVKRLIAVEELSILVTEANSHLWASTLLNTSFAYIEKLKNERSVGPPPEVIPNLRFVQAGVGLCLKEQTLKRTKTKKLSFSALIEEMLPPERPFTRFTGNAVANPAPFEDDLDNYFLDFMLFLQHLQYKITQGKCYISDWQGTSKSLSIQSLLVPSLAGNVQSLMHTQQFSLTPRSSRIRMSDLNPRCSILSTFSGDLRTRMGNTSLEGETLGSLSNDSQRNTHVENGVHGLNLILSM